MEFFIVTTVFIEINNTATRGSSTSRIPYGDQFTDCETLMVKYPHQVAEPLTWISGLEVIEIPLKKYTVEP